MPSYLNGKEIDLHYVHNEYNIDPNLFANAIKMTKSNTYTPSYALNLENVSPIEHKIKVNISDVDNPKSVKLIAHSKNLFDTSKIPDVVSSTGETVLKNNGDGSITVTNRVSVGTGVSLRTLAPYMRAGKRYIINAVSNAPSTHQSVAVRLNGGNKTWWFGGLYKGHSPELQGDFTDEILDGTFYFHGKSGESVTIYNIQIEEAQSGWSGEATNFEEYSGDYHEYTPNNDGTVEVKSISPTTVLSCDERVSIRATYNRDTNIVNDLEKDVSKLKTDVTSVSKNMLLLEDKVDESYEILENNIGERELMWNKKNEITDTQDDIGFPTIKAMTEYVDKEKREISTIHSGAYRVSKSGTNTLTLNDVDKPEHDITVSALKPVSIDFSDIKRALEKAGYTCEEIENGFIINGTNTNNELVYGYTMPNEYYPNISRVTLYCTNSDFEQNLVFMYGDGILFEPSPEPKYVNSVSSTLNLNIFPDTRITLNNAKLIFSVEELIPNIPFKVYGNSSEYTEYTTDENGQATVKSIYPYMRMVTTSSGVNLAVEYNKDLNKAFNETVEEMTDYVAKELENNGCKYIKNFDSSNPTILRNLEAGLYFIQGFYAYYNGAKSKGSKRISYLVSISQDTPYGTYAMIIDLQNYYVQQWEIIDDNAWQLGDIDLTKIQSSESRINEIIDDGNDYWNYAYPTVNAVVKYVNTAIGNALEGDY